MESISLTKTAKKATLAFAVVAFTAAPPPPAFSDEGGILAAQLTNAIADSASRTAEPDAPWDAWTKVSHHSFEYDITGAGYDGDATTLHFGFDHRLDNGPRIGATLGYVNTDSKIEVVGSDIANSDAKLFVLNPYIIYPIGDESTFWSTIGYGTGDVDVSLLGFGGETDIKTQMVALGFRTEIHQTDSITLALDGSAFLLSYETDEFVVTIPNIATVTFFEGDVDSSRARLALEASGSKDLPDDAVLSGKAGLGIRYDDGDEEEGAGVDVAAGIDIASLETGLTFTGEVNWLLHHNEDDYEEWGLNLGVSVGF